MLSARQLTSTVAFFAGVGCATAVVDEDPGIVDPPAGTGTGAVGGTMLAGVGGSGTGATGGTGTSGSAAGGAGTAGSGGTPTAGRSGGGAAGAPGGLGRGGSAASGGSSVVGAAGTGVGGGGVVGCTDPRMPMQPGALQGNSGSFETTDAVCYFVEGTFNNWSCSNPGGRTVTINGTPSMCGGALPDPVDGGYYFEFGASTDGTKYTSFYWYTS